MEDWMEISWRERKERMKETDQEAWDRVEEAPESVRGEYGTLPRLPIELIACRMGKGVNHGGLLRLGEAFRIERVVFEGEEDRAVDFAGHRGALKWQAWEWGDPIRELEKADQGGRQCVAVTLTDSAVDFAEFDYRFPLTLVVGSEKWGVPPEVVERCESCVAIPMFGMMGSINVATATAIVLQQAARKSAQSGGFRPARRESSRLLGLD